MAIVSSTTLIRAVSLFHITVAYYLLANPSVIPAQGLVALLGASVRLVGSPASHLQSSILFLQCCSPTDVLQPTIRPSFAEPDPAKAFAAVLLAFLGVSDLASSNLITEAALHYWTSQAPVRIFFLFICTGYVYLFKQGGLLAAQGKEYVPGIGEPLKNDLMFTFGFVELSLWYWVCVLQDLHIVWPNSPFLILR